MNTIEIFFWQKETCQCSSSACEVGALRSCQRRLRNPSSSTAASRSPAFSSSAVFRRWWSCSVAIPLGIDDVVSWWCSLGSTIGVPFSHSLFHRNGNISTSPVIFECKGVGFGDWENNLFLSLSEIKISTSKFSHWNYTICSVWFLKLCNLYDAIEIGFPYKNFSDACWWLIVLRRGRLRWILGNFTIVVNVNCGTILRCSFLAQILSTASQQASRCLMLEPALVSVI